MIIISHRGFLDGNNPKEENNPAQIDKCINSRLNVEIDVWYENQILYLGHDYPAHKISLQWLEDRSNFLWVHCKNLAAIDFFVNRRSNLNFFFHNNDDYTLTSHNFIWTFPNLPVTNNCVIVSLDLKNISMLLKKDTQPFGICTDYPIELKRAIQVN
jgi:hypothetical protein